MSLSEGQLATVQRMVTSQNWKYTLRKVLSMAYDDQELSTMCAVGRKGAQNKAMDKEDLGALKGNYSIHTVCHTDVRNNNHACMCNIILLLPFIYLGFIQAHYPDTAINNERFNTVVNSACCGARRRCARGLNPEYYSNR